VLFGAETYRLGALERLEDARLLKDKLRFALSMYAGGVAVEGALRSLCCLRSREFDERHDLRTLATRVEELGLLKGDKDHDFVGAVANVAKRWRNTLRFGGETQLERFLISIEPSRKRLSLKYICGQYYNSCSEVLRRCEILWQRSQRRGSDGS